MIWRQSLKTTPPQILMLVFYICFLFLHLFFPGAATAFSDFTHLNESIWSSFLSKSCLSWIIIILKTSLKMNEFVFLVAPHTTLFYLKMPLKTKNVNCFTHQKLYKYFSSHSNCIKDENLEIRFWSIFYYYEIKIKSFERALTNRTRPIFL